MSQFENIKLKWRLPCRSDLAAPNDAAFAKKSLTGFCGDCTSPKFRRELLHFIIAARIVLHARGAQGLATGADLKTLAQQKHRSDAPCLILSDFSFDY